MRRRSLEELEKCVLADSALPRTLAQWRMQEQCACCHVESLQFQLLFVLQVYESAVYAALQARIHPLAIQKHMYS